MITRTTLRAGAVALATACALLPAGAQAKPGHHGLACGRGHARHSHAVGHTCARHHGRTDRSAQSRDATTTQTGTGQTTTQQQSQNPAQQCRDQREKDPQGFSQAYGDRPNAFGRCVSQHARQQGDGQQDQTDQQDQSDQQSAGGTQSSPTATAGSSKD